MLRSVALFLSAVAVLSAADPERRLYVTDKTGISIYDIDHGHKLLHRIDIPDSGNYKGIAASAPLGRLYVTSANRDELICVDLKTEKVLWRRHWGGYADSPAITPDGKRLYVPYRDEIFWKVIDAQTGDPIAQIDTERGKDYDVDKIEAHGPHNTWINENGRRAYLALLTVPYVYIADTSTNKVLGKVGPFSKGIRPLAVTEDDRYVFANVDGLLGFEVAEAKPGGKMLYRVEAHTPAERLAQIPNPPARKPHLTNSHGVNVRPDQKEVWMVDGVYGYVYVYDITSMPPKQIASVAMFRDPSERPHPGWMTFGVDGRYAYPDGGAVIDTATKKVVAWIPTSEKLVEIDFENGKAVKVGHR
jgi:DNA-binding beta-propeller fold protein YncE